MKPWKIKGYQVKPPYSRVLKVLLSPDTHPGVRELAVGMVIIPPHSKSDRHSHENSEELWIVVGGHGKIEIGGETADIEPGVVVHAPAGIPHQLFNTSEEPLIAYYIFAPPGPERETLAKIRGEEGGSG